MLSEEVLKQYPYLVSDIIFAIETCPFVEMTYVAPSSIIVDYVMQQVKNMEEHEAELFNL